MAVLRLDAEDSTLTVVRRLDERLVGIALRDIHHCDSFYLSKTH